jgi:hypothetical protein
MGFAQSYSNEALQILCKGGAVAEEEEAKAVR